MIFGDKSRFAIEAVVEPDYPTLMDDCLMGRLRLHFGGETVGDFSEPSCVLGVVADELTAACSAPRPFWDSSLASLTAAERHALLDEVVFLGAVVPGRESFGWARFLESSELFDGVKAFLLAPPGELLQVLVVRDGSDRVVEFRVPPQELASVAEAFEEWRSLEETRECERAGITPTHPRTAG